MDGPVVVTLAGAPFLDALLPASRLDTDGAIAALGVADGVAWVGTDQGSFAVVGGALSGRGDAAVRAMTARDGGLIVATDEGIRVTVGDTLVAPPEGALVDGVDVVDVAVQGRGDDAPLWVLGTDSLVQVAGGVATPVDIGALRGTPAVVGAGLDVLLVGDDHGLYEAALPGGRLAPVPFDLGAVHDIGVSSEGTAFVACDAGLFVRARGAGDGSENTLHTLSDEPLAPPVTALFIDSRGNAVASTALGVVGLREDVAEYGIAAAVPRSRALAIDGTDTLFAGSGSTLVLTPLGAPAGFEADVAPILESHCHRCHLEGLEGTPRRAWDDYDTVRASSSSILFKVTSGEMPPEGEPRLTDEEISRLLRWVRTGERP